MWQLFKQQVKLVMESPPSTLEDVAKAIATSYDAVIKMPPAGDIMNKNPVLTGGKELFENLLKIYLTQQSNSVEQLPLFDAFGNALIVYWGGASLAPLYPPLIPVPGATANIPPVTQVLVTNPGQQISYPFIYNGLDNVDEFIDKFILLANLHLTTVSGIIITTALFPGPTMGLGFGSWSGYSMTGNSELNGIDPSKYFADEEAIKRLKDKFNNLTDPETLRQQLQAAADAITSALPPVSGDAAGIGEAFTPDLSKYDLTQGWIEIATQFISRNEGFKETPPGSGISVAANDYGRPRLGYGTDRFFLPDGRIKTVEYGDSVDKPRALAMLKLDIAERFYKRVVGNGDNRIPIERWNELRDTQKAALISLAYNAGSLYSSHYTAVMAKDDTLTAQAISSAPIKAGGEVLPGLVRRRKEEAQLYLS